MTRMNQQVFFDSKKLGRPGYMHVFPHCIIQQVYRKQGLTYLPPPVNQVVRVKQIAGDLWSLV